jgi:uncharacterized protein (DUF2147 family)
MLRLPRLAPLALSVLAAGFGPAAADPLLGLWQTEPDQKGQVGIVQVRPCGPALCGRVVRVIAPGGADVVTRSMGRDLFWGLVPLGEGRYGRGRVWVPLYDKVVDARARLAGDSLTVQGCLGPVCDGQTWRRRRR